jgi:DNA-binding MarR family transcriptional regulator
MPSRNAVRSRYEPEILNSFRRILKALRLAAVQTHAATGISAAQLFVLSQLESGGALSINELAQATMTDRSSVADVVDRLVERRLVRRSASAEDRRRAEVRLTAQGRALLRRAPSAPTTLLLDGLAGLTASEVQVLSAGLARLCEELGLTEQAPEMLFEQPRGSASRRRTAGKR